MTTTQTKSTMAFGVAEALERNSALETSKVFSAATIPPEADPALKPKDVLGELLRRGERAVLGSTSKSGKSWLVTMASVCKAAGLDFLGRPLAAGPVLHIDLELLHYFLDDRVRVICKALKIEHPAALSLWPMRKVKPRPTMAQLVAEIKRRYLPGQFEMVVLEPSYKMVQPTEQGTNSEMMVARYLESLDELAEHLDAAVITTHHSPKGDLSGRASLDLFSGTGVWARDPDLLATLRPHENPGHAVYQLTRRHGPPVDDLVLAWQFPLWIPKADMDATAIAKPGRKRKTAVDDIVRLLEAAPINGWSNKEWEMAANRQGIASSTFYQLKKSEELLERVEVLGSGRHPTYRLKGRPF